MKEYDLSKTTLISFEINNDCNMKHLHRECPINTRKYRKKEKTLTSKIIIECINQAKDMNFNGYITFHNYNEPLISKEEMLSVIDRLPQEKYLLWTNGLLLDRDMKKNEFLKKFKLIYISCYHPGHMAFFKEIQAFHGRVHIEEIKLDDRLDIYSREPDNIIGCKRPLFDLPIDHYGNVHLCCFDWNNEYEIGNIFYSSLKDIIHSDRYQKLLASSEKRLLDLNSCPVICKRCNAPWITYTKYYDIYEDSE